MRTTREKGFDSEEGDLLLDVARNSSFLRSGTRLPLWSLTVTGENDEGGVGARTGGPSERDWTGVAGGRRQCDVEAASEKVEGAWA